MQITRAFSFALLAIAAGACSSSSSGASGAPVIDDFNVPSTVAVGTVTTTSGATEAAYVLVGTLDFHDSVENVGSFQTHVTSPANTVQDLNESFSDNNGPGPLPKGPLQVTLALPATGPFTSGAKIDYEVTITSVSGKVSEPISESVTLQ